LLVTGLLCDPVAALSLPMELKDKLVVI